MSSVDLQNKTILVTGAAGFIGSNLIKRLYDDVKDVTVIGIDNMNDYYDVRLKELRLSELTVHPSFVFIKGSIADKGLIKNVFKQYQPQVVVNLGVTPKFCVKSNECRNRAKFICRRQRLDRLPPMSTT